MVITEADLFFTTHPLVLLRRYSPEQLEAWFGPSSRPLDNFQGYANQLLNDIWQKYSRVDLIKWDPELDASFFDYRTQKFISLPQLNENLEQYSLMSLRYLGSQLNFAIARWNFFDAEPFRQLLERINQKLQKAMVEYIFDYQPQ